MNTIEYTQLGEAMAWQLRPMLSARKSAWQGAESFIDFSPTSNCVVANYLKDVRAIQLAVDELYPLPQI